MLCVPTVAERERKEQKAKKEGIKLPSDKSPSLANDDESPGGAPAVASSRLAELSSRIIDSALRVVSAPFTGGGRMTEKQRAMLKTVVQRLQRHEINLVWNTWVWQWEEARQVQRVMANAIRAMQAPEKSRGFHTWQQFYEERVHANALIRNVILRLSHGKKLDAIVRWRENALQARLELGKSVNVPSADPCSMLARCLQR